MMNDMKPWEGSESPFEALHEWMKAELAKVRSEFGLGFTAQPVTDAPVMYPTPTPELVEETPLEAMPEELL